MKIKHKLKKESATLIQDDALPPSDTIKKSQDPKLIVNLRLSEERLKLALDVAEIGTFSWHIAKDHGEYDARMRIMIGQAAGSRLTLKQALTKIIHTDDQTSCIKVLNRSIDPKGDGSLQTEIRVMRPDGSIRYLCITGRTHFSKAPRRALFMHGIARDMTERRHHEANLALLNQVSEDLVHFTNLDETLQGLCEKLGIHFCAGVCAFSEIDEDAGTISYQYSWHSPDAVHPSGVYQIDNFHSKEVREHMRKGIPEIVPDTASFPKNIALTMASLKIGAYVNTPLIHEGRWRVTLSITDIKPRNWREDEIELMRELTNRIWTRVERTRVEEALKESQERLTLAQKAANVGIWDWDMVTGKTFWSETMWHIYGYKTEAKEVEGDFWNKHLYSKDRERVEKNLTLILNSSKTEYADEFRIVSHDGSVRWVKSMARIFRNKETKPMRMSGLNFDTTSHKLLEEEILDRVRRQTALAHFGQYALSGAALPLVFNEVVKVIQDTLPVQYSKVLELMPDEKKLLFRAGIGWNKGVIGQATISSDKNSLGGYAIFKKKPITFENVKDEKNFIIPHILIEHGIKSGIHVLIPGKKGPYGVLGGCSTDTKSFSKHDIDFLQVIAAVLSQAVERKRLEERKDEFINIASHELKTPVTSVKAFAQILESRLANTQDEKNKHILKQLNREADRLSTLIDDLLNAGKIEAGKMQFHMKKFDLTGLTKHVVTTFRHSIDTHTISLIGKERIEIVGDKDRMEQVLTNLISNAIKYSPQSDKVVVRVTHKKTGVVISVQDFGMGVLKKDHEHIFERFYRTHNKKKNNMPGFGLGLYISEQIIKRLEGEILLKSERGKGSTFYVTFPNLEKNNTDK